MSETGPTWITFVTVNPSTDAPVAIVGHKLWTRDSTFASRLSKSERIALLTTRKAEDAIDATEIGLARIEVVAAAVEEGWQECGLAVGLLEGIEAEFGHEVREVGGERFRLMVRTARGD